MRRSLIVATMVGALVAMVAGTALAKDEGDSIQGSLVISGPGLDKPIVLDHPLGDETSWEFEGILEASGLMGAPPDVGWYELAPDRSTLGAGYGLDWVIRMDGRVYAIHQVLYPFGTGRPWFYTAPGTLFRNSRIGQWWSGPPAALNTLRGVGFPRSSVPLGSQPAAPNPAVELPQGRPAVQPASARPWVWAATIAALTLLLALGVVSGRRHRISAGW